METAPDDKLAMMALDMYLNHVIKDELIKTVNAGLKDPAKLLKDINTRIQADVKEHGQANFDTILKKASELMKQEVEKEKSDGNN